MFPGRDVDEGRDLVPLRGGGTVNKSRSVRQDVRGEVPLLLCGIVSQVEQGLDRAVVVPTDAAGPVRDERNAVLRNDGLQPAELRQ